MSSTSAAAEGKDFKNSVTTAQEEDPTADNNSEAETIVLAGKDGSPVKSRKVIKREHNSDDERPRNRDSDDPPRRKPAADTKAVSSVGRESSHGGTTHPTDAAKRKRVMDQSQSTQSKDSSGLSSAPASPLTLSRGRSADGRPESDSESAHAKSSKPSKEKDKDDRDARHREPSRPKHGDKVVPHKRKAPRAESDDEAEHENHKARRVRTSASIDASSSSHRPQQKDRDHPKLAASKTMHENVSRHRSISPHHSRTHRRSMSTQVQSTTGSSSQKKRRPPPLSTEYHSDESSASGSPHIRSSTMRGLATPATAESNMSAPRNPGHKKHVDAHGQTQLAKACQKGEYDIVKKKLLERPQDLDYADYAGNTPLQIAAIHGHERVVKLLVESGCDIDCVNHDKDTPLLDAVDNGHLGVIKVLLDAGVNPRKANVSGQEPLDRVDDELDNADLIRKAIIEAKGKMGDRRKTSEERPDHHDARSSHGADSPRRSPTFEEVSSSRRVTSARSHKLSNQVLYMSTDDKTLRAAAARGDAEQVERILQVRQSADDPEAMVAAARGGHYTVMNLLLALGGASADPPPVSSAPREYATPILAAIGQENLKIVELLVEQSNFNPTKRFQGDTYYEIARKRGGPNWKEEEHMLKQAYDKYKKAHKETIKKSPNRKEQDSKRARADAKDESAKPLKRKATSPVREGSRLSSKLKTGDRDHKGAESHPAKSDELTSPKRGPGRPKKDERGLPMIAISDEDSSPSANKSAKTKRPDPDTAGGASESETTTKVRRRLISGGEVKENEKKNRRASMVSNSSSLRDPSSPRDARHDDPPSEKYHDRAKAIKRDESRDRLSVTGDHSAKRSRTSTTPDHGVSEKEGEPVKKRRTDGEKKERASKSSVSPDRSRKPASSRETPSSAKHDEKPARKHIVDQAEKKDSVKPRKQDPSGEPIRRESGKATSSEKSIHVKSEDADAASRVGDSVADDESKARAKEDEKRRRLEAEANKKEKEAEERKRQEQEERRLAEAKKREEEQREKRRVEEEERKKREEEQRKKREEEERKKREEEEAQQQREKEEEARRAEETRIRLEKEEQERKKREEEERARKEKEAAEEAQRRREDEERREKERQAREEQRQRRAREEQEKKRLEKLPAVLRWLDQNTAVAQTREMAMRLRILRGVRFDSIQPDTAGTPQGRELWILNTQVALLLGESDIQLARFSGWTRVPATEVAKHQVMKWAQPKPALVSKDEWDLGKRIPGYYFGKDPSELARSEKRKLEEESHAKFLAQDLFFVKLSDLMYAVPSFPHLRDVEVVVKTYELAETLEQHKKLEYPSRWKQDPDAERYASFAPLPKYYVNGVLAREDKVELHSASFKPWPQSGVVRDGLTAVHPTDPSYARLAKEQGLGHLIPSHLASGLRTPPMTTGAQTSPNHVFPRRAFGDLSPPQSESTATANGDGHHARSSTGSTAELDKPLVNGHKEPTPLENGAEISLPSV